LAAVALVGLAGVLLLVDCRAREDAFWNAIFSCTKDSDCGTTRANRPMICYPGIDLQDGSGFCAEACDPAAGPADPAREVCAPSGQSGALLKKCQPVASGLHPEDPTLGCPAELRCFRTNLLSDSGLCVKADVCSPEVPCPGSADVVCSGAVIDGLIPKSAASLGIRFQTDNFQCVMNRCQTGTTDCGEGACFGASYHLGLPLDDLCVPRCDSGLHCPPNFSCGRSAAAPSAPAICIPGLPGTRCVQDQDCLIGKCVDVGLESNVCSLLTCSSNKDCAVLSSTVDRFVCAKRPDPAGPVGGAQAAGAAGAGGGVGGASGAGSTVPKSGWCVALGAFHGANCCQAGLTCSDGTPSCPEGFTCFTYGASETNMVHGECRLPCSEGECPVRSGVPLVCLGPKHEGGCHPATLGMPCELGSPCVEPLTCQLVPPDPRSLVAYSPSICTIACSSDADCADGTIAGQSYCGCGDGTPDAAGGGCLNGGPAVCRLRGPDGSPCDRSSQCGSLNCNARLGQCAAAVHP